MHDEPNSPHEPEWRRKERERLRAIEMEIELRPAEWTVPNGESYTHVGPGVDEYGRTARVLGTWIPNEPNPSAVAYTFVPGDVPGETEDERLERLNRAFATPVSRRVDRDIALLRELFDDAERNPVALIYCAKCDRRMASIYLVERSYIVTGSHFTFWESRMRHLNYALAAREQGYDLDFELRVAAADVDEWPVARVLDPLPKDHMDHGPNNGYPADCQLVGCRSNGTAMFSYAWLRQCGKDRRDVRVDPAERWFVLPSELPTDD